MIMEFVIEVMGCVLAMKDSQALLAMVSKNHCTVQGRVGEKYATNPKSNIFLKAF